MSKYSDVPVYSTSILLALTKTVEWYQYQNKFNGTSYLPHLLRVMGLVWEFTRDENTVIASVLHGALEDVGVSNEEIHSLFGPEVSNMITFVTEDKALPKVERKQQYINGLTQTDCPSGSLLISMIDKYDSLINDYLYQHYLMDDYVIKFYYDLIEVYQKRLKDLPTNQTITLEYKKRRSYRSMLKEMKSALLELKSVHINTQWLTDLVQESEKLGFYS